MPRGNQLIRQWRILRAIESCRRGCSTAEIHREVADLGTLRTVYRDLEILQEAGFPLYQEDDGRWRTLTASEGAPAIPVEPTEMIALLLSEQAMAPLRGSALAEPLVRLRAKLEAALNPKGRQYVELLRRGLLASVSAKGNYSGRHREIACLERAIRERRTVRLVHFAAHRGETLEREVDPYGLWYVDGGLYLVAFDHLRCDVRKFLVDRIEDISILDRSFEPDPDFDLEAYVGRGFRVWHGAIHRVIVVFSPTLAHLPKERCYHRTQKIIPQDDGSCRVVFDASGLAELAGWVASFGGHVRVLDPPELVQMVRDLHQRGLEAHA